MSSSPITFTIRSGFRAFVAGVSNPHASTSYTWIVVDNQYFQLVNAGDKQRAFVKIVQQDGGEHSVTLEGQGVRVHMKDTSDESKEYKSFGPFTGDATIYITITHKRDGVWKNSKTVGPLSVSR